MSGEKLILKVYKSGSKNVRNDVVRVGSEAMEILVEYQRATGLPMKVIAGRMIRFAAEHTEIVEK